MNKRLDLHEFNIYEKFGWIVDYIGDYDALDELFKLIPQGGIALEKICVAASVYNDEPISGDFLAWWLEGSDAFEAVQSLESMQIYVEHYIDDMVRSMDLDVAPEPADGFNSQNQWLAWRNK